MADQTQAELEFAEARAALKAGKIVIVTFADGRRDIVNDAKRVPLKDDEGKYYKRIVQTLGGWTDDFANLCTFDNCREAQDFLFNRETAKAA